MGVNLASVIRLLGHRDLRDREPKGYIQAA